MPWDRSRRRPPAGGRCWALDPGHAEARDYLQAAGGDGEAAARRGPGGERGLLGEAIGLLRGGDLQEGLALLETQTRGEPGNLEAQAFVELARGALLRVYRGAGRQRRGRAPGAHLDRRR